MRMSETIKSMKEQNGGVKIAANLKRTREMINANGDVIDPVTKEIIKNNVQEPAQVPKQE